MSKYGDFAIRLKSGINNTIIKFSPEQASSISDALLKFSFDEGTELEINWFKGISNHYYFELSQPIQGRYNWYAFEPHVDIIDKATGNIIDLPHDMDDDLSKTLGTGQKDIPVPYLSQRDNANRPKQTCNMTCAAMVIEFFHPGTDTVKSTGKQLEDVLTKWTVGKFGNDGIYFHSNIQKTLLNWNVKSEFNVNTPFVKIKEHLSKGNPVIYSGKFTSSGHIIVLRGYDDKGFFVNDPWGEWFINGYQKKSGERLHYSYRMMSLLSYSGDLAGWAHLCEKI